MGKVTGISWTDHTFNAWWGCTEVSPACDNCYAREVSKRFWPDENLWTKNGPRRFFPEKHWNQLFHWNAAAAKAGVQRKVFVNSMADLFEDRRDLDPWRLKLFGIVEKTPNLIYQFLTKRDYAIHSQVPQKWKFEGWPANVWMGVTAENQRRWDERIANLKAAKLMGAKTIWVSAEPLLGDIAGDYTGVDWVVVGGESGSARRMAPEWATNILARCRAAGTAYFFKQKGDVLAAELGCTNKSGKDPSEWPAEFRVQEFPGTEAA